MKLGYAGRLLTAALVLAAALTSCSAPEIHAVRWRRAVATPDGRGLTLVYATDRCETFAHAEIAYHPTNLVVTLYATPNKASCLRVRFPKSVLLPLHEDLAGRTVLDGTRS